ncbi:mucin-3A-like [Cydia pomonella]|uniref:mucin-3A-like n=1 Tax=Cydia pomonella TaxID=82600 RepID=UPI002ADE6FBE|nr:mucin-3A-like [Cydia pomonella]
MCVPTASTKIYMNELFGTLLILSALLSTASAVDCHGKSFHCVNSTHFMICVDLGGGVSQAIDDFYIACPPPTVCQGTNYFECEFPAPTTPATTRSNVISETTLPWENIITSSSLDNIKKEFSENYINTERTTTVEYSVTTDTTVDVVTRTAATFNINNELNVTEIATTTVPNITTSPIETISQTISEDRSITDITLIAEGVTTSVIEAVTETVVETKNSTRTDLTVAGEESNTKAININTQTTTENIVITETETAESIPMTTEQIIQTTTDNPLEIDTSYLYTELPQVLTMIQNENLTNNTLLKKSSIEKKKSQAMANQNLNIYDKRVDKHSTDIYPGFTTVTPMGSKYNLSNADVSKPYHTELHNKINNQSDLIKLEGGIGSNLTAVTRKQPTNDNEKNNLPQIIKVNDNKHDITSNFGKWVVAYSTKKPSTSPYSVFLEVIAATDVPLVGDNDAKQKNDTMGAQNDKHTTILDGAFTIETEQPTTIYEENFTKDSTQNTKTVNLDIVTTEAIPGSNVQLVTTKAPSLILSSAGTTTVDGAYTIETVIPTSEHPTTIYEDIFTKDSTQNIETVNQDIVTTEAVDITFSNSDIQLVTTQAPSLTQSSADTTIVDGAYTIETVENIPTSEHPTTFYEENFTKDSTQNIETVNLDIATTETVDIPFSNSNIQLVTTQAPSLTQSSADTTIVDGAYIIETVENIPTSEHPTTFYEENFTKDSTQNIETVNLDIATTETVDIPFSNSNIQLVTTQAQSLTQSSADTTTVDGAYHHSHHHRAHHSIETVENIPTSEHPTTINEENFTKDSTQNIETVNLDIATTETVDIPFSNSDIQLVTTQAPSLTQSSADATTVDGAYSIETVENIPTSEHPTTINEENFTKDSTQNIETVNLDIATTENVDIPFSNSDLQLVTTQAPSLTQSSADTTTVDGPYIVETVQNALSSEHPTTIDEENLTKDTTQNMETVNLDIITTDAINIQFSNNDVQLVTAQVPLLMQSSADTTTLGGAFTIETGENAPSSEQPTIVNEDKFDTVNVDIVTTEAIHIPFSNSDVQLITTPAPSLTQGSADTTTLDGAFTIELVENAPSSKQPTTVNKENVPKDSIQNIVNVDILTTDAVDVPFTNSNVQLGATQVPSLTQSSGDTNLDRAFTIETVKKNFSTEQTNMTNEQGLPIDTVQNTATENIIITTSKAINRDTMNTKTIYESSTIINDQSVMTEESHVTKSTVEVYTGIEQTTTIHEENGTTGIYENVASQKVPFAIGYTQSITSKTQNPEKVKQDVTMIAEIIENGAITEQPITTNAKKSTTGTIQNVATEYNIIPTRHSVNFYVTTEVVSTPTTMNNYHIIQVASEDYTSTKAQLLTDTTIDGGDDIQNGDGTKQTTLINKESVATDGTRNIDPIILPANQDHTATETVNVTTIISNAQSALGNNMKTESLPASGNIVSTPGVNNRVDFITPKPINIEQKITKLPGDKLVPNTELPTYLLTTNNNYANLGHANDDSQQNSKTEFLGPKRESNDISNQTNISQNGESQTIRVKKIVEGQYQTANINWNPFDNHLIDKSDQISELTRKSDVTDLNAERNDPNVVSSDKGFVSQQHILLPLLASNPSPAEIYNRKQSYNATTITQSSDGILATNGLPENKANVNSQPEFASLPTPKPITLVKEHSTYLKTNTFASGGSVTLSSSKTVPTNANVADTKILDNTHNNKIIPILFSAGLQSTVEETGSKVREIKSNVNVSSDNKKMENPKNSKTPITVDLSNIKDDKLNVKLTSAVQNDKIELQTNTHDLSETINMRITTEGYHNDMGESSNPGMLDILPLPIYNIEPRPSVANILLLTDVTSKTRNGNVVLTTESYKSETFYPTLANTPIQASVNGVHNTNAPFKNLPTFDLQQPEVTNKVIGSKNPTFGGSTTVGNPQKYDITTDSTFSDVNSPIGVIKRADVSPPHPVQVGQVSIRQTNTPNNVYTTPKEQNVSETNSPQTSNARENEPQKNNSPINLPLSISTQKPYANTVQTLFQSVIPHPILPVTKQVANETAIPFTCVNGIRGRYSAKDDCRKFYICFGNNQPVVGNCPENTVFSDIKKLCTKNLSHCIRQNEFKCPSAGRFSDFMKDNVYYICVNHMDQLYRFKFQCQKGYIFNKTTVKCIESKEIESNESVSISLSDNSSQTGSSSIASSSINNNSVTTSRVSNNSSSDDSSSKTDDVSMTKKTNEAEETPEKSEENEDDKEEEIFECKKEGKFPIRNECRRYYLCKEKQNSEYRRKIKKCGSGRVFHKDKKKCVHADSYEC